MAVANLVSLFEDSVTKYRSRRIFGVKPIGATAYQWINYETFGQQVTHLRGGLAYLGIRAGDRVAIIADNSPSWAVCCYAVLSLGAAFVPMYMSQTRSEWEFKIKDAKAKLLFVADTATHKRLQHLISADGLEHILVLNPTSAASESELAKAPLTYDELLTIGQRHPAAVVYPRSSDLMGIIYTSGTTSDPKGVMITHGNVVAILEGLPKLMQLDGETSLSFLPWAHIFGQMTELHVLLRFGNAAAFVQSKATILTNLKEVQPTIFYAVPAVFQQVYSGAMADGQQSPLIQRLLFQNWCQVNAARRAGRKPRFWQKVLAAAVSGLIRKKLQAAFGGRLKMTLSGGGKLDAEVAHFIASLGIVILEAYGLSETTGLIAMSTPTAQRLGSVGLVFPGMRLAVDPTALPGAALQVPDSAAGPAAPDTDKTEGELIAYGPHVMAGYLNQPGLTRAEFTVDGGLRTGDLGWLDSDGFVYITGRLKEIYKLQNGKYIVPGEYEGHLQRSPLIADALLYGCDRPHTVVLLSVAQDALLEHATRLGLGDKSIDELLATPAIEALFAAELNKAADSFPAYLRPRAFKLLSDAWTPNSGLATPTLKLKRHAMEERYQALLASFYEA